MDYHPIVVGGTGGSGTRLAAQIVEHTGVYMGSDLNYAHDALPFVKYHSEAFRGRENPDELLESAVNRHMHGKPVKSHWGWKNPLSMKTLWHTRRIYPDMKFVHVIRDGRDMAYAPTTSSLSSYWSGYMPMFELDPVCRAAIWFMTNMQAASFGESVMGNGYYYRVRYEDLCDKPGPTIRAFYEWMRADADLESAKALVKPRPNRGRWKGQPSLGQVNEVIKEAQERFGYA